MRRFPLCAAFVALAAGVWGADCVVERGNLARGEYAPPENDAELELKWDDGRPSWLMCWYTGEDSWVGNDFDISTLATGWWIKTIKVVSGPAWPNGQWDGFRLGVFTFSGSLPGSRLHGPKYVRGTGSSYGWCGFDFGMYEWSLLGNKRFVVAVEQYYNYPGCDPYVLDSNQSFQGHSWQYQAGKWEPLVGIAGYRNLMVRVIISDLMAVVPTSVGRVKALYY